MPDSQFVQYLQEHGVTFKVDDDFLKDMKGEGASEAVLAAIGKAAYHEVKSGWPFQLSERLPLKLRANPTKRSRKPRSSLKVFTGLR